MDSSISMWKVTTIVLLPTSPLLHFSHPTCHVMCARVICVDDFFAVEKLWINCCCCKTSWKCRATGNTTQHNTTRIERVNDLCSATLLTCACFVTNNNNNNHHHHHYYHHHHHSIVRCELCKVDLRMGKLWWAIRRAARIFASYHPDARQRILFSTKLPLGGLREMAIQGARTFSTSHKLSRFSSPDYAYWLRYYAKQK